VIYSTHIYSLTIYNWAPLSEGASRNPNCEVPYGSDAGRTPWFPPPPEQNPGKNQEKKAGGRIFPCGIFLIASVLGGCDLSAREIPGDAPMVVPTPVSSETALPALSGLSIAFPKIDRRPAAADWGRDELTDFPRYDPASDELGQVDLRGRNLSGLDLQGTLADLLMADFDTHTIWPPAEKMPGGFDAEQIMSLGANPGLGVRALHGLGITGRGVGIAIIDEPLLVGHQEYADRLQLYEEIDIGPTSASEMHGPAVASIAVGKTVGAAPDADL
jgi:subtilisin family serine protease